MSKLTKIIISIIVVATMFICGYIILYMNNIDENILNSISLESFH